ncbi:ammonium transporter [Corynebacterium lowii]|uniref:Ammonium transporter n=1 Tax=Corynebacterium lowii TaxID=1544413 RepID=A0A0Q0ZA52_9CORY|nr:ammonium transporter [Corynebacterium lowii]KQB86670.1 Ammonia channel precursor [Corynebacterium lowii]MDP9851355.1 Amt family ammonium transporter [Corynebacterium lowii]
MASEALFANAAWVLVSACLVLLMTPALALFYGGMSGRKVVLNMMMMSFGALGVVTVIYLLWGWSMSYGTQSWGGLVANPSEFFGLSGIDSATEGSNGYPMLVDVAFQLTFAIISTAIISGALAGRVKFSTWLVFCAVWPTLVYFPLAHMVWGGGLLSEGENSVSAWIFGTTAEGEAAVAPIDFAGGTVVHISAGAAAFVLALVVGKRQGFPRRVTRPHNLPMVMLGAALLWFGWCGFNAGSALAPDGMAALAWVNTAAAAAAGMLAWLATEWVRYGHATSLGGASGVVAGLVAITPAAGALNPMTSLILGAVGGVLACLAVSLKFRFGYDDSLDVVGVHLVAGLWGTVGIGILLLDWKLTVIQIIIALVAVVFSGALTAVIALALKATMGWRVDREEEYNGVDYALHAESAYDVAGAK